MDVKISSHFVMSKYDFPLYKANKKMQTLKSRLNDANDFKFTTQNIISTRKTFSQMQVGN